RSLPSSNPHSVLYPVGKGDYPTACPGNQPATYAIRKSISRCLFWHRLQAVDPHQSVYGKRCINEPHHRVAVGLSRMKEGASIYVHLPVATVRSARAT